MRWFSKYTIPAATLAGVLLTGGGAVLANTATSGATTQQAICAGPQGQAGRGFGGGARMGGGYANAPVMSTEVLAALKVDLQTFIAARQAGESINDIAVAHEASVDAVANALKTQLTQRIDQAVTYGRLTQDQAQAAKAAVADRVKTMMAQKGAMGPAAGRGMMCGPGATVSNS